MNRSESVAIVAGSLILGLMKTMDKEQQTKGSTVRYSTVLRKGIKTAYLTPEEREKLSYIAHDSMIQLVEQYEDAETPIQIATFIESLSFSFEKEMMEFYGKNYFIYMLRFIDKQVLDEVGKSYEVSDTLRDNIRKIVYDRLIS